MQTDKALDALRTALKEIAYCNAAKAALEWDMETGMPVAGSEARAETVAFLAGLAHEKSVAPDYGEALTFLREQAEAGKLSADDSALVALAWRQYDRERRLSGEFVRELSNLTAASHHVWAEARRQSAFGLFRPNLERIVALKREQAQALGGGSAPYDALLDEFEPGARTDALSEVFGRLRRDLSALVRKIQTGDQPPVLPGISLPLDRQVQWNRDFAALLGFDFQAGRLDVSAHPFTMRLHVGDVRITTRYDSADLLYSLMSTAHETGHALYEQGLPAASYGTPVGEAASLGLHESQSRLWENLVARSRPFCDALLERLQGDGHLSGLDAAEFYRSFNRVTPSLIRTEADEVTYNLHICLRFEIERDLIEGRLAVADLPEVWNAKMNEYLGVAVPSDADGVLQDVHWSSGLFGYFPTYALGNIYSAQLFEAARRDLPDLDGLVRRGDFAGLRRWLHDKIHRHGSRYGVEEMMRQAVGDGFQDPAALLDYLERKYGEIYRF